MTFVNPRFSTLLQGAEAGEVHLVDEMHAGEGFFEDCVGTTLGPIQHGWDPGINLPPDRARKELIKTVVEKVYPAKVDTIFAAMPEVAIGKLLRRELSARPVTPDQAA